MPPHSPPKTQETRILHLRPLAFLLRVFCGLLCFLFVCLVLGAFWARQICIFSLELILNPNKYSFPDFSLLTLNTGSNKVAET